MIAYLIELRESFLRNPLVESLVDKIKSTANDSPAVTFVSATAFFLSILAFPHEAVKLSVPPLAYFSLSLPLHSQLSLYTASVAVFLSNFCLEMSFSFLALLVPRRYLSVVVSCTNYNKAREPILYPYCKQLLPLIATTVASSGAVCLCCKCAAHESQICRRINFAGPTVVTAAFVFLPSLLQWLFSDFFLFFCS